MNFHRLRVAGTGFGRCFPVKANSAVQSLFYRGSSGWCDNENVNTNPSKLAKHRITIPVREFVKNKQKVGQSWKQRKHSSKHAILPQAAKSSYREATTKPHVRGQLIYGRFPVITALQAKKREIYQLYLKSNLLEGNDKRRADIIQDIIKSANENHIPVEAVSKEFLNLLVDDPAQGLRQHQGVCADVSPLHYVDLNLQDDRLFRECAEEQPKIWLVIQSVQDPNNFGAMLRSAYYLGVDRIIGYNSCKLSPAVSKVSAGVLEVLNIYKTDNLQGLLQICHNHRWQIFGTTALSAKMANVISLTEVRIERNTIVILGNEGYGMSDDISSLCDQMIVIPSQHQQPSGLAYGMLDSLNVSVASGIIVHNLVNNRNKS